MEFFNSLVERIARGSRQAALGLAASCGERVIRVYNDFWVGDFFQFPQQAIDIGWGEACGNTQDRDFAESLRRELQELTQYYNEEGITILASSVTVTLRIIEGVVATDRRESALAAARACGSAIYVAELADSYIDPKCPPESGVARAEEESWVREAAARVESWTGPALRDMFADLGPLPPGWWSAYEAAPTHI
jgi:hypothetical protein